MEKIKKLDVHHHSFSYDIASHMCAVMIFGNPHTWLQPHGIQFERSWGGGRSRKGRRGWVRAWDGWWGGGAGGGGRDGYWERAESVGVGKGWRGEVGGGQINNSGAFMVSGPV